MCALLDRTPAFITGFTASYEMRKTGGRIPSVQGQRLTWHAFGVSILQKRGLKAAAYHFPERTTASKNWTRICVEPALWV